MARFVRSQKSELPPGVIFIAYCAFPVGISFLIFVAAAWSQQQSTPPPPLSRPIHMVLRMVNSNAPNSPAPTAPLLGAHLNYYGGPVISNLQVVVVFWGPDVYSSVTDGIGGFFENIANSAYFDLLSEYDTNAAPIGGGTGTNQSIGRGTYGGSFTITPSVCNVSPCTITDDQVQTEFLSQLNAGQLPTPELDSNGNVNTLYMIYFPPGVTIDLDNLSSCNQFCAYHSTTVGTFNSKNLAYGVMPDFSPPAGCRQGCGTGTDFENVTAVSSHEMAETVTDIDAGLTTTNVFPLAWYDPIFGTGEIADICDHKDSEVSTPGGPFLVQLLWSNRQNACVIGGSQPGLQLTAPATAMPETSFNFAVTVQNPGDSTTDTSFAGTIHFTSSDPQAGLPPDFTFTPSDQGKQDFNATLKKSSGQTITATETVNSAITGTTTVTVAGTVLTFVPASVGFGSLPIGSMSLTKIITLTNGTGGVLDFVPAAITGTDAADFALAATTCGATLATNNNCTVGVTFTPVALGARSATLTITDDAGNSPQQIALSGIGTAQVSVTPPAVKFPPTMEGKKSAVRTITVTNNMKSALVFSGSPFTFAGADPGNFARSATTCGNTLPGHAHCTVSITFTPIAQGIRTAVLNVADSGSPSPQMVNLSGTGR